MVHRMSRKVSAGGLKGKAQKKPSSTQLLSSLQAQIGEKEHKNTFGKRAELEEERCDHRAREHRRGQWHGCRRAGQRPP